MDPLTPEQKEIFKRLIIEKINKINNLTKIKEVFLPNSQSKLWILPNNNKN